MSIAAAWTADLSAQQKPAVRPVARHKIRPERNVFDLIRPWTMIPPVELPLEIVDQVGPVMDHVRLIDREHGIAQLVRRLRQVPMSNQRYQLWRAPDDRTEHLLAGISLIRLFSPFRPPELVVFDIEQQALERPVQHAPDRALI